MMVRIIEPDDIDQEVELRKLQGKIPNRGIVTLELNRKAAKDPSLPEHIVGTTTSVEENVADILMDWASDQSDQVMEIMEDFLDDPEQRLTETIDALTCLGIQLGAIPTENPKRKKVTYKGILQRALPATQDDLIQALSTCPINRPASTVRQFLRRHKEYIYLDDRGVYNWKAEALRGQPTWK